MLELRGIKCLSETSHTDDIEFLEEVMEKQEEIEASSSQEEFEKIKSEIQKDYEEIYKVTMELFEGKKYEEICPYLVKLKYSQSLGVLLENRKLFLEGHNLKSV